MTFAQILPQVANGLVLGSMYALVAIGFSLVLGSLHRLNLAHPEMFMLGGFVALVGSQYGLPAWLGGLAAFGVGGVAGLTVERISFRGGIGGDAEDVAALSSVAVGVVLVDLVQKIWGTEPVPLVETAAAWSVRLLGVRFTGVQLGIVAAAFALMAVLHLVLRRTRLGRAIRAVAENPAHATLLGIDARRTTQMVFLLSAGLGAVAGFMLALRLGTASSDIGFGFGLKALAVMAIGGMADLRGAVAGGLIIGVVESLAVQFGLGRLADLSVWALLILVLVLRPQGLFGGPVAAVRA